MWFLRLPELITLSSVSAAWKADDPKPLHIPVTGVFDPGNAYYGASFGNLLDLLSERSRCLENKDRLDEPHGQILFFCDSHSEDVCLFFLNHLIHISPYSICLIFSIAHKTLLRWRGARSAHIPLDHPSCL
jgi:hypothetical protein